MNDTASLRFGVIVLAAMALATCGSAPEPQEKGADAPSTQPTTMPASAGMGKGMMGKGMMAMCPMAVEGATVEVEDVEGGVALKFATSAGDVKELRSRVHRIGEKHAAKMESGMHGGKGAMMHGGKGAMMHGGKGDSTSMVPHESKVEDVETGARMHLTPKDPAQLGDLREHARQMAARMGTRQCPMMMMMKPASTDAAEHEAHHPDEAKPAPAP